MSKLAIDIGFSSVKAIGAGGFKIKFPTAVAVWSRPAVEFESSHSKPPMEFDGRYYLVGEDAFRERDIIYSLEIGHLIKYAPLFIAKAIDLVRGLGYGLVDEIVVGLPTGHFKNKWAELWERVRQFSINGKKYEFHKKWTEKGFIPPICPQGVGILYDYAYKNGLRMGVDGGVGFSLDIGFNTVLVVAHDKLVRQADKTKQYDKKGISKVADAVGQELAAEYGINNETKIELSKILLTKSVTHYGKKIDLADMINKAMSNYIESVIKDIRSDYETWFSRSNNLIIGGGGAYYIDKESLPKEYEELVQLVSEPEFSNARGYYVM